MTSRKAVLWRHLLTIGAFFLSIPAFSAPAPDQSAHLPSTAKHPPHKTVQERLLQLEKALALAGNEQKAQELTNAAENLRIRGLTGATKLLLRDSQDALSKHDFQTAVDDITSALTLQPDKAILRRDRAEIRLAAGDMDGAIADLGVELQSDPQDPIAWGVLAQAEQLRHEPDAALRAYQKVISLNPYTPQAKENLKKFEKAKAGQED
ncbi:tetratricopeptide repeat protein [Swingsia samuiensis]|uniref:Uncharacterized protein n=1 Tax=Swingsia samuiensis TaxID=1293412 RepID=A0A4Y6UL27_9PROT|nr:tetratricopeptide repeat protein [Swingsia samuiensis]QDH17101.1 hypothetical protein E3D00_05625 [Swingsia samuiensis]